MKVKIDFAGADGHHFRVTLLKQATSPSWIAAAVADPATILVDHAHCEKKAASTAVGFLFRHPGEPRLCQAMSRLAREELVHFERVLAELARRGIPFGHLPPSPYGGELHKLVRPATRLSHASKGGDARGNARLVDELLVCALIEARSRERFTLLAAHLPDRGLAALYEELGPSEERHAAAYVELACLFAPEAEVMARLDELAAREAEIVAAPLAAAPAAERPGTGGVRLHAG